MGFIDQLAKKFSAVRYATATRTGGDIALTSTTLVPFDTGLDLVLPAKTGDVIEATFVAQCSNQAGATAVDFQVLILNNGTAVRSLNGDTTVIIPGWTARAGDYNAAGGSASTKLTAADINGGTVTLRLMGRSGGSSRTVFANAGSPAVFYAKAIATI